ncbi:MAG TPA: PIN domain-containing protein [Chloroflexota bacterium]
MAEFVRKRTEWIAYRALREGQTEPAVLRARLAGSRARVNDLLRHASDVLRSVDHERAPAADLSWLTDPDDIPVMKTALAARADTLVTDNARDFPLGSVRNGVLILGTAQFRDALFAKHPGAPQAIAEYLGRRGA